MDDLGKRFADGDEEAFNEVVEQYSGKIYGLCYRILRDREEAKDMTQEVWVRIYSKRKSFRGKSSLYTWFYRIALNNRTASLTDVVHRCLDEPGGQTGSPVAFRDE